MKPEIHKMTGNTDRQPRTRLSYTRLASFFSLILFFLITGPVNNQAQNTRRSVSFLATGDPQISNHEAGGNQVFLQVKNLVAVGTMNNLVPQLGRTDNRIRGLIIAGDLTQNARRSEWDYYLRLISGKEQWVYDGRGNHDYEDEWVAGSFANVDVSDKILEHVRRTSRNSPITSVSTAGNYSWDWDDVHFVHLNLYPCESFSGRSALTQKLNGHSCLFELSFLAADLKANAITGKPVVLVQHYGFDSFTTGSNDTKQEWWTEAERKAMWDVIAPYNVIAIITGHRHTPGDPWNIPWYRPAGSTSGPQYINTFVAGGARDGGYYLAFNISDNSMSVQQFQITDLSAKNATLKRARTFSLRAPENIALGKTVTSSSVAFGGVPSRAVDGITYGEYDRGSVTHSGTEQDPWLQIDLGAVYDIEHIRLWNRTDICCDEWLDNFSIYTSINPIQRPDLDDLFGTAFRIKNRNLKGSPYDFYQSTQARYIRIQLEGPDKTLVLAEVEVFGPFLENLALGKSATSSSTGFGGVPSRAVDGNTDGEYNHNSVTHNSSPIKPWVQIDLGAEYDLYKIRLWNRTDDCCRDRLNNFTIYTSTTPIGNSTTNASAFRGRRNIPFTDLTGNSFEISTPTAVKARYVQVQIEGNNGILHLAEIQVYGTPLNKALGRPVTTSAVNAGDGEGTRATDGMTSGNFWDYSVTHSQGESNPWLEIDLGKVRKIKRIKLWNRTDCCSDRLDNFTIKTATGSMQNTVLSTASPFGGRRNIPFTAFNNSNTFEISVPTAVEMRYIQIRIEGNSPILSLAEVQVFEE
ncbi:MAG: discoidin domain-containing protein [Lewinellaceae bacterium]|nr:discoidin domain-containing protein [Lewinellaceae bacterium]